MDILILSRNPELYSTHRIAKAARKNNHYVRIIDHMYCDLVLESGNLEVYYNNQKIEGYDAIIPRIGASATGYGSLVIRQFVAMGVFTTLNAEALLQSRDKLTCAQILMSNDIKSPKTITSNYYYFGDDLIDNIGIAPHIVKLVNGTHGSGVLLSEKKSMTKTLLESFSRSRQKVLAQEFIEEAKGTDIRVFVVDNEIVAVMKRQAQDGEFRSNLHLGGTSAIERLFPEEIIVVKKAVKLLGLKIAGVDLIRSDKGPMILEVNASPGLEGIETTTGINIAAKIIRFVERNANPLKGR